MNAAFLHLSLTHFPIIGFVLFSPLFLFAVWKKKQSWIQLFSVVLVGLTLVSIIVFNTGEGAEDILKETTKIPHKVIHEHEEAAEFTFWLFCISGFIAALVLALRVKVENARQRTLLFVYSILLLVTSVAALRTAHLGGEIRHPEMEYNGADHVDADNE
ncbi:MAG: hypothetical protein GC180_11840 [Bacteroidetes bacterium]|nr:hypothetical protein [Bacteroidota bacterium]